MAIECRFNTFAANTSTGNQTVSFGSAMSAAPDVVLFFTGLGTADGWTAGLFHPMFGVGKSSSNRWVINNNSSQQRVAYSTACVRWSAAGIADFVSSSTTGYTINWSVAPGSAQKIHSLALDGFDNTYVAVLDSHTTTGNKSYTGFGFQPDGYLICTTTDTVDNSTKVHGIFGLGFTDGTNSYALGESVENIATSDTERRQSTSNVIDVPFNGSARLVASHVSMDADGITLNYSTVATTVKIYIFAWKGGASVVGNGTSPASTGTQAISGTGVAPTGGLLASWCNPASASIIDDAIFSIGGFESASRFGCSGGTAEHAVAGHDYEGSMETDEIIQMLDIDQTLDEEANLSSVDSSGITLDWTTAVAAANQYGYLFFGDTAAPPAAGSSTLTLLGVG